MELTEAQDFLDQQAEGLVKKKTLILTVKIDSKEQAHELIKWMYSGHRPVAAELLAMHWDSVVVDKDEANFIAQARELFASS